MYTLCNKYTCMCIHVYICNMHLMCLTLWFHRCYTRAASYYKEDCHFQCMVHFRSMSHVCAAEPVLLRIYCLSIPLLFNYAPCLHPFEVHLGTI